MTTSKPWYKSKAFNLTLGLIVTAAALWWAWLEMSRGKEAGEVWSQIGSAFKQANYISLPFMWIALFVFYWLKAWRWRLLLARMGDFMPMRDLFPPIMIGFGFNNLLPAHLGEFVRVYVFSREQNIPQPAALSTVVLERVFDIIAILLFLGLGLTFVPGIDPSVRKSAFFFAAFVGVVLAGSAAFLAWTKPMLALVEKCLDLVPGIPGGLKTKVTGLLETAAEGLSSLRSGPLVTGILLTSIGQWALNGILIHLSLWSFGIHVSPLVSAIVLGVTAFGVTVPSSPGYFGVIQLCFLLVLKLFVSDDERVFAASIYYHMAQWIPVTAIGLMFFLRSGLKVSDVEQESEREPSAEQAE